MGGMRFKGKRGLSVIISSVLFVIFVVSLGLIVSNWSGKIVGKGVENSKIKVGTNIDCAEVNLRIESLGSGKVLIKNNDKDSIEGFVTRLIKNDGDVLVDYKHNEEEISGFNTFSINFNDGGGYIYENSQGNNGNVDYSSLEEIEIIPRIDVEDVLVDCDMKKTKFKLS